MVAEASMARQTVGIAGGNTRKGLGRPVRTSRTLISAELRGISFYEPAELVIGARSGTRLVDIDAALAEHDQMLAFEPMDHRSLYATDGAPTIGAVAAANISGPRRILVGAARDSLLGVRMINGRGELIKSGGRVMKNVTGLDLVKLVAGSHGTLGFVTEVTFKVLPKAEHSALLVVKGLSDVDAISALSAALASPYQPSGAAHLPAGLDSETAKTLVRVEGSGSSVSHRVASLKEHVHGWADAEIVEGDGSSQKWQEIRDVRPLAEPRDRAVWRVSTVPSRAVEMTSAIAATSPSATWYYDWGGGLIWLSLPADGDAGSELIRNAVAAASGHATLIRAPDNIRREVPVFQPQAKTQMMITAGIKRSFDPGGIFEPGRMYAGL